MKIVLIGPARSSTPSPVTMLQAVAPRWRRQAARLFDPYRPEQHYMRGPGPKCRERHGLSEPAL